MNLIDEAGAQLLGVDQDEEEKGDEDGDADDDAQLLERQRRLQLEARIFTPAKATGQHTHGCGHVGLESEDLVSWEIILVRRCTTSGTADKCLAHFTV